MKNGLFISVVLLLFTTAGSLECFCQSERAIIEEVKTLAVVNNKATVKGFPFDKILYSSKDSLNKGITIILQNPSYKIVFFSLAYECENCDIWIKTIYGNTIIIKDAPIMKRLKKNEALSLTLFKVEKAGKYFTIPEVNIIVTD